MLRSLAIALVLSLIGGGAAQAGTAYRDPSGRFTVDLPSGWMAEKPAQESPIGLLMAMQRSGRIGVCVVIILPAPETNGVSQAELDDMSTQMFTEEYWRAAYAAAGGSEIEIESVGNKDLSGHKAFFAVVTVTISRHDVTGRSKSKQMMHIIPGSVHAVSCLTKAEQFAEFAGEFETVFDSYVPRGALVAQAPAAPPSVLTLYSGARFDGVRQVVMRDTPNLAQLGWSGATASLAVAGLGQWQFCEGLNYSGRCGLARRDTSASFGLHGVRIGSVRKLASGRVDLRRLMSLGQQATGLQLGTVARALQTRR